MSKKSYLRNPLISQGQLGANALVAEFPATCKEQDPWFDRWKVTTSVFFFPCWSCKFCLEDFGMDWQCCIIPIHHIEYIHDYAHTNIIHTTFNDSGCVQGIDCMKLRCGLLDFRASRQLGQKMPAWNAMAVGHRSWFIRWGCSMKYCGNSNDENWWYIMI